MMHKIYPTLRRAARAGLAFALPFTALGAASAPIKPVRPGVAVCGCPAPARGTGDLQAISLLAVKVCADAVALPAGASVEDLEAAIVYALSQSETDLEIKKAALRSLIGCSYGQPNFAKALARVLANLENRKLRRGTAATGGATFTSGFTSPGVNVGGGSSNYGG
jgi:hypothetical protein